MKKIIVLLILSLIAFEISCTKDYTPQIPTGRVIPLKVDQASERDILTLNPQEIVNLYFQSWKDGKYEIMHSLISDDFKKNEPSAKTFEEFKNHLNLIYAKVKSVDLIDSSISSQEEKKASVTYKLEIEYNDKTRRVFTSSYNLSKTLSGWKIDNPYGGKNG